MDFFLSKMHGFFVKNVWIFSLNSKLLNITGSFLSSHTAKQFFISQNLTFFGLEGFWGQPLGRIFPSP